MPTSDDLIQRVSTVLDEGSARKLERDIKRAVDRAARAANTSGTMGSVAAAAERASDRTSRSWMGTFGRMGAAATSLKTLMGAGLVGGIGVALLEANRQAQSLMASLTISEGSAEEARARFKAIEEFAARTPFQIDEVTKAYLDLRAAGVSATEEMMTAFGDLATTMPNKTIRDFTSAVQDALTGEMERLKEFGIVSKQQGDKVQFTFKGQTTEVERTRGAILEYLQTIGQSEGVQGAMTAQMATLNGIISNLWDNMGALARIIGEEGFTKAATEAGQKTLSWTQQLNENRDTIGKWTRGIIGTIQIVGGFFVAVVRTISNAFQIVGGIIATTVADAILDIGEIKNGIASFVNFLIESFNKLPGVPPIDFRAPLSSLDVARERARLAREAITSDLKDIGDAWADWVRTGNAAGHHFRTGGTTAEMRAVMGTFGEGGITGADASLNRSSTGEGKVKWDKNALLGRLSRTQGSELRAASLFGRGNARITSPHMIFPAAETVGMVDGAFEYMRSNAETTAQYMTDAFAGFFQAFADGIQGDIDMMGALGAAAKSIGKGIVASLLEGWAGYAMARGTASLAEGLWPPNPAALAASAAWFSAAGLFRALGGAIGGAGRSTGLGPNKDTGVGHAQKAGYQPPVVNIYIDPLDPSRPAYQKNVAVAGRLGQELIGRGGEVRVHPANG